MNDFILYTVATVKPVQLIVNMLYQSALLLLLQSSSQPSSDHDQQNDINHHQTMTNRMTCQL